MLLKILQHPYHLLPAGFLYWHCKGSRLYFRNLLIRFFCLFFHLIGERSEKSFIGSMTSKVMKVKIKKNFGDILQVRENRSKRREGRKGGRTNRNFSILSCICWVLPCLISGPHSCCIRICTFVILFPTTSLKTLLYHFVLDIFPPYRKILGFASWYSVIRF